MLVSVGMISPGSIWWKWRRICPPPVCSGCSGPPSTSPPGRRRTRLVSVGMISPGSIWWKSARLKPQAAKSSWGKTGRALSKAEIDELYEILRKAEEGQR